MALTARFLIDTSAAARMSRPEVSERLRPLIEAGLVATCAVLDAEALFSARSADEYAQLRADRRDAYEYLPTDDEHWQLAFDAQFRLARAGRHRSVGISDLLTSVIASRHRLTVVHYDADFEIAATVLDFEHAWVAPAGTC
ncbi:PIN domain nuclease [Mycobacterium sp. TNTM28]|uniref:Ribonuclease VapC n=1 Tax=[Mycobacterium] fortunisiensis TaxID=2600579 RepID=A0ABS6KKX5_9MYCO|nr:PIN domain-containing protein [[Mycobacterium] fortunisiensis]MBU9764244.1 PIN domain nuclease [[Mycobacterium] fortunisiensis]